MSAVASEDRRIRSLRPRKSATDPWRPHGSLIETERRPNGKFERALTIFLTGAECPFTCSFCDLWRWTIEGPTPRGALPAQVKSVLESLDPAALKPDRLKLYNASNFFDRRAVPLEDVPLIAALAARFHAVTVESHASLIGASVLEFASNISGRLEVALGLETVHPVAARHLNKRLELSVFERAVSFLLSREIDVRVFALLGTPHVPAAESIEWTVRTVEYAVARGASVVSIIPVRSGNGELERLYSSGHFAPPTLMQLEAALDRCLTLAPAVVCADLWDIDRLVTCSACGPARIERLKRINETGKPEGSIACANGPTIH